MNKGGCLGGGFGCFTWLGIGLLTWVLGMGGLLLLGIDESVLNSNTSTVIVLLLALGTLILSWRINLNLERKWTEEKAEADRREDAERDRERELERKFYRENPERLVTEFCPECNMQIPAFARICPYCRSRLRE